MGEVRIRPATVADVPGLRSLGEAVVPATYAPIDPAYAAMMLEEWWSPARLAAFVEQAPHVVAEVDDVVVGVANLGRRGDREVMWKLYVHPDHQARGIGTRLLDEVAGLLEGDTLWLEVVAGNDAAGQFYRARGFREVERVPFPPWPDDIWLCRRPGGALR